MKPSVKKGEFLLLTFFFLGLIPAFSQSSLSGIITDKSTGESLTGVNIYLPEYSRGTVSGVEGNYKLKNLRHGQTLVQFSMIGYKTRLEKINISPGVLNLSVEMEPKVIQGEEIVVTGGFPGNQHDNVVKISTLKPKLFLTSGSPSFIETLTETPGIDLISKGPGVGTPVIRGLSLNNVLFLNNGIPMNNFQFSENHPFMIDENGMERIEIIKGPASLLYGSGAVGGVLNLIKEAPAPEGKIMGDYIFKYFGNTHGVTSNLGMKGTQKSLTWGFRVGFNSNMDYFDGENERVPNSRFNRKSFKTNLGLIKNFGSFRLFYDYNQDRLGMSIAPALILVTENGRKNEVWYQDLANHILSMQNKIFIKRLKFDFNLGYQNNNRKLFGSATAGPLLVDINMNSFNYKQKKLDNK
jgi:iron complex outermembrane receptor protein